jgi:hypothetical protein
VNDDVKDWAIRLEDLKQSGRRRGKRGSKKEGYGKGNSIYTTFLSYMPIRKVSSQDFL